MKKLISVIIAVMLLVSFIMAEENDIPVGSESPLTITLDSNPTTGFTWTAFVMGGDSAVIIEELSGYVADENPDMLDGVGGTHYFVISAVKPGDTIIRFSYGRGWTAEDRTDTYLLVTVDEDMRIWTTDVTMSGVYEGTVLSVNAEDHSVMMNTELMGEVVARFDEDMELPVEGEVIEVYTNGTMTMSLPAIVNVIAWSSVPGDMAR